LHETRRHNEQPFWWQKVVWTMTLSLITRIWWSLSLSLSLSPLYHIRYLKNKNEFLYQNWIAKKQGTKWVQIRKLGLNWTFLANFEPTHFRCLFYIGHFSFNFSHGQQKESNWPLIFQLKDLVDEKQFGDKNEKKKKHCSNPQWIVRECIVPMSIVWKLHLLVFFIISR